MIYSSENTSAASCECQLIKYWYFNIGIGKVYLDVCSDGDAGDGVSYTAGIRIVQNVITSQWVMFTNSIMLTENYHRII